MHSNDDQRRWFIADTDSDRIRFTTVGHQARVASDGLFSQAHPFSRGVEKTGEDFLLDPMH
jgi:hypothetical protein